MMAEQYVLSEVGPSSEPCPPFPSLSHQGSISVYHSGCNVAFFRIPCYPHPSLDDLDPISGAHLGLILDACEIITNNKPGFLGTSKDRTSGIPSNNRDLILSSGNYYYHLIDASIPNYPIVTEFDAWIPPSELPQHWQDVKINDSSGSTHNVAVPIGATSSVISQMVKNADAYCAVTGASSRLNTCHLIPKASVHWFIEHSVYRCFEEQTPNIDESDNLITLRADINGLGIDQGHFVFVPIRGQLTVYFITKRLPDLAYEFHCRRICLPARIPPECLYYRFAWSVFQSIVKPLLPALSMALCVPVPDGILERRKPTSEHKGTIKGKLTAAAIDNRSQPMPSQSDNGLEHQLDLSALYNPEIIPVLVAEDARIKEKVGPALGRMSHFSSGA